VLADGTVAMIRACPALLRRSLKTINQTVGRHFLTVIIILGDARNLKLTQRGAKNQGKVQEVGSGNLWWAKRRPYSVVGVALKTCNVDNKRHFTTNNISLRGKATGGEKQGQGHRKQLASFTLCFCPCKSEVVNCQGICICSCKIS